MSLREDYHKETGKNWCSNDPDVTCSDNCCAKYLVWLEDRIAAHNKTAAKIPNKVLDLDRPALRSPKVCKQSGC
jgi:hypothetical protein